MTPNQKAFLDMLAFSEGTSVCPVTQDNGYDILVGGTRFDSYADHPRILVDLGNGLKSTAAGRYQLLERYYDAYKKRLNLPDFSPASQDAIALEQIKERMALDDIENGNIASAIAECCTIWASLPGNNYGQHQQKYTDLENAFLAAGGKLNVIE